MKEVENHNTIDEIIETTLTKIKSLSDSNTIIGDPITSPSGTIIIPVSKVSVGFVVGGGEYSAINKKLPFPVAGGSGGGVSVSPLGFIVETNGEIKFVDIENKNAYQTIINFANTLLNKLDKNIKKEKDDNEDEEDL